MQQKLEKVLKLGLPKGSLQEATFQLLRRAGFDIGVAPRSFYPSLDDPEIEPILLRAQEISRYVAERVLDAGITGLDWITENGVEVVEVCELVYSKGAPRPVRWVLAVPNESPIQELRELQGKLIVSEVPNITKGFLDERGVDAKVEFSWGATEAKARLPGVAAIMELTDTEATLRAHNLRVLEVVMESTPRLIASKESWQDHWKRSKLETLSLLLRGACLAQGKVGLKLNVAEEKLEEILALLPSMKRPTVSTLAGGDWFAVESILDEEVVKELIPKLKRAGAEGIIEYPLNKVIP